MKLGAIVWVLAAVTLPVAAAESAQVGPWVPSDEQVRGVLDRHPLVRAAIERRSASLARSRALRAGPVDTVVRAVVRERQAREVPTTYREADLAIERPWRPRAKRESDASLADAGDRAAAIELADTRHELGRELLTAWFDALRARVEHAGARQAADDAAAFAATVLARVRRGDAARVEADLASADADRLRAAVAISQADEAAAYASLRRRFPGLPDPADPPASLPDVPPGDRDALREEYVARSHERALAQADGERALAAARRAGLERRADPTVGIYLSVERGGLERIAGITLSWPIGGAWRGDLADAAAADAGEKLARVSAIDARIAAEFDTLYEAFSGQQRAEAALRGAAALQASASAKTERGYAIGEFGIAEVLLARRALREARAAAQRAAVDAARAMLRLQLDLHRIWDADD